MGESPVKLNLLANGRLIFANSLGNGGLCGAVGDAGENDTAFL